MREDPELHGVVPPSVKATLCVLGIPAKYTVFLSKRDVDPVVISLRNWCISC